MAIGDRQVFYKCNVTFQPTGSNTTVDMKVASISLNEEVAEVDLTTTEDGGDAFIEQTIATHRGQMVVYKREGEDVPVKKRDKGVLTWNDNAANTAAGNHSLTVQIGSIQRGQAEIRSGIPVTINFAGQGGWANGSFGA